jgi:hypothetical protein
MQLTCTVVGEVRILSPTGSLLDGPPRSSPSRTPNVKIQRPA